VTIKEIAFRVDCGRTAGFGHLVRSFALAQKFVQLGYTISFFVPQSAVSGAQQLLPNHYTVFPTPETTEEDDLTHLKNHTQANQWVVIDSYLLSANYYRQLHFANRKLFKIDDFAEHIDAVDVVLNSNFFARDLNYQANTLSHCTLMLGPPYHPIRDAFWAQQQTTESIRPLLLMGGSDPTHATLATLNALALQPELLPQGIDVIIGPANQDRLAIEHCCSANGWFPHYNPKAIAELMAHSSIIITAAGSTTFEALFFNKPMVLLVAADNQRQNAHYLQQQGLARLANSPADVAKLLNQVTRSTHAMTVGAKLLPSLEQHFKLE
jgi:UDP-2,4-diacetamido-2,4,6-trideoxy-beta-L-altropyranose hydrolase